MKRVTVFGGSRPSPGETDYQQALRLGRLLGEAGYTVLTGGYMGSMEAVSRGAAEAGGRVIGVTCDEIEAWRPVNSNPWVQEELRRPTLRQRLFTLIEENDAALALPGGPGTLTEIMMMWNLLLVEAIPARPLILIGPGWQIIFEQFYRSQGEYIPESQRRWLSFASNVDNAFEQLQLDLNSSGF
jgi:uncharacterized protein (TIGR00730 family)